MTPEPPGCGWRRTTPRGTSNRSGHQSGCTITAKLQNVAAQFGTPVDTGGKLYLADQDTGQVTVINDVTGTQ